MRFSAPASPEIVKMTILGAENDWNVVKMATFRFSLASTIIEVEQDSFYSTS